MLLQRGWIVRKYSLTGIENILTDVYRSKQRGNPYGCVNVALRLTRQISDFGG